MGEVSVSLVCTFLKTINNYEPKVDAQKGPMRLRGKLTLDVLFSFNSTYFIQMTHVLGSYYHE